MSIQKLGYKKAIIKYISPIIEGYYGDYYRIVTNIGQFNCNKILFDMYSDFCKVGHVVWIKTKGGGSPSIDSMTREEPVQDKVS